MAVPAGGTPSHGGGCLYSGCMGERPEPILGAGGHWHQGFYWQQGYYWQGMEADVQQECQECPCALLKQRRGQLPHWLPHEYL